MNNTKWTSADDALLLSLVKKHHRKGKKKAWGLIAKQCNRTERSVSQRYYHLRKTSRPKTTRTFLWGLYSITKEG